MKRRRRVPSQYFTHTHTPQSQTMRPAALILDWSRVLEFHLESFSLQPPGTCLSFSGTVYAAGWRYLPLFFTPAGRGFKTEQVALRGYDYSKSSVSFVLCWRNYSEFPETVAQISSVLRSHVFYDVKASFLVLACLAFLCQAFPLFADVYTKPLWHLIAVFAQDSFCKILFQNLTFHKPSQCQTAFAPVLMDLW